MTEPGPTDIDEPSGVEVAAPRIFATGIEAVVTSMRRSVGQMGLRRTASTLRIINQPDGFDCPGCAWPEPAPDEIHRIEFCESGAKAVAEEATRERADEAFFREHSLDDLRSQTDFWLGRAGRLTRPLIKHAGDTHYRPTSWEEALETAAARLRALSDPDEAIFYTSGRTSNEAAYLYQLMAKSFGTNNLPDCSNMCHEPTSVALQETIGIGKGSVRLSDFVEADVIVIAGQNPGSNHPRMLTTLEAAKRQGAKIIAINPLPEAGLLGFKNPQTLRGLSGVGIELADVHLPIRLGADHALFQLWNAWIVRDAPTCPARIDRTFIDTYTSGFEAFAGHLSGVDTDVLLAQTGLDRESVERAYEMAAGSKRLIICWSMGITQHLGAVDTIKEIVNLALLGGHIGRVGAGLCPVRGHSNVQGDRTMGIWEKVEPSLHESLEREFGVELPSVDGFDTIDALRALHRGDATVFVGLGGNFARATPDTDYVEAAFAGVETVVHFATKLNRTHLLTDHTSIVLPVLGRTEVDVQPSGDQYVTVEDSMGMVHASRGMLAPPSAQVRSEVSILADLATRLLGGDHPVPWTGFADDYHRIRDSIGRTIHGFNDFNARVERPGGFELPHPPRDARMFETPDAKAHFTVSTPATPKPEAGELILQTLRSHDQYNTTIYGHDDRYRGLSGDRHVVMMNPDDIDGLGFSAGDRVDLVARWRGIERRVVDYQIVAYPTPVGTAAAYYPETNVLIANDHHGTTAQTPASKSIRITVEPTTTTQPPTQERTS